jgi:hypothetical protein
VPPPVTEEDLNDALAFIAEHPESADWYPSRLVKEMGGNRSHGFEVLRVLTKLEKYTPKKSKPSRRRR